MSTDGGDDAVVALERVRFGYDRGSAPVLTLDFLRIQRGERIFLRGPSGCGKSTLLSLLSGVVVPWSGEIRLLGHELHTLRGGARDALRASHIGVIFQLFNLVPYLSVVANVTLPCRFSAARRQRVLEDGATLQEEARRLLARLGLGEDLQRQPPTALSVGQQQRVAAARALIGRPELVLADEPTSALDAHARDRFITLLSEECARGNSSLLFVSHDGALAHHFDRTQDLATLNQIATE
ncbi:MAG: ATP-binding cassette domain-containing protein [Pseudomonadota bacterium]